MDEFEKRLKDLHWPKPSESLDQRITSLCYRFGVLPMLLPGESVLFSRKWIWVGSVKSLPSYRVFMPLPPFCAIGLYVTDRRVLTVVHLMLLFTVEVSQWYEGKVEAKGIDTIKEVRSGRVLGIPFLEIVSESSQRHWFRSPRLRMRLFIRDPEPVCRLILQAAKTGGQERSQSAPQSNLDKS